MITDLILATRNPRKVEEVVNVFVNSNIRLLTLEDVGIVGEGTEDGKTLEQNAFNKSWFAFTHLGDRVGAWAAADDTGLFIDALGGQPGVRSARWAGDGATTNDTMHYCLERMEGITDRAATFRTTVTAFAPDGTGHIFMGALKGRLLEESRAILPNMPYAGLFVPEGEELCLAEMTIGHENTISHRGKAFNQLRRFLEHYHP